MTIADQMIATLMKKLDISEQEALQVIEDDKKIDKGEPLFEQTAEQKANSKLYRQGKAPTVYNFTPRERKADEDKRKLIELIAAAVGMVTEAEPTITRPEGQIDFEFGDRKFRVVLSAPRK